MTKEKAEAVPQSQDSSQRAENRGVLRSVGRSLLHSREASIFMAGIVLVVYFQSTAAAFLSPSNIANLAEYAATTAIIAAGEVMVLVCGEVDLSVGQVYALAPFVMYYAHAAGVPYLFAILLGLIVGAFIGLSNGIITVMLGIPSFIATLGTLFLINGVTLTISGGFPVGPKAGPIITNLFGGNPVSQILWALVITLAFQFMLVKTRWGLHTIATGGNLVGAAEVGIKTNRIKIGNFIMCSVMGGVAGILDAFRISSIDPLPAVGISCLWPLPPRLLGGLFLPVARGR
jgi:simple sugar transport system permease protein